MAFLQRPQVVRQPSYSAPAPPAEAAAVPSPQRKRTLDESEEWILFAPAAPSATNTQTTSTERTPRTAGLSRLSDFGSLDTAARSDQVGEEDDDDVTCHGTDAEEDGTELDSLDYGLHAFHEPSEPSSPVQRMDQSGGTVLPAHDGLGMFPASSALVQEHIYQFERHNPRRVQRRRSSVQRRLDALDEAAEPVEQDERMQRIEKWRMEQSRALVEEIERETRRRRRMSQTRSRTDSVVRHDRPIGTPAEAVGGSREEMTENESFWQRLTRRVIDLIGIDETTLSAILGETLLAKEPHSTTSAPISDGQERQSPNRSDPSMLGTQAWEHRLLERIALELGVLVHQLTEHPGAFSTYAQTQETPPYAGLPTSTADLYAAPINPTSSALPRGPSPSPGDTFFAPTLPNQTPAAYNEASLWGIEEEPDSQEFQHGSGTRNKDAPLQQDREYWERELNVKMVFSFLLKRFSTRAPPPAPARPEAFASASSAPPAPQDPLAARRRAALIRQHHPLLNRTGAEQSSRRRDLLHRHHLHHHHHQQQQPSLMRGRFGANRAGSSSCASQSTKKSKRSGSSRNYWDIGGSVGSGPALNAGVWGEA